MADNQKLSQFESSSFGFGLAGSQGLQADQEQRDRVVVREFIELLRIIHEHVSKSGQNEPSEAVPHSSGPDHPGANHSNPNHPESRLQGLSAESRKRIQDSIRKASM